MRAIGIGTTKKDDRGQRSENGRRFSGRLFKGRDSDRKEKVVVDAAWTVVGRGDQKT